MTCHVPANPTPAARFCQPHAAGFSLVELSVAVAISGIIFMALGSAMVLASRALPDKTDAALASHDVGRVLEQLSTDLQHALYVSERSAHAITFTVADRTGDGSPQRMRYAWSGEPGEPLTWQLDDHEPVELLLQMDAFDLDYESESMRQTYPAAPVPREDEQVAWRSGTSHPGDYEYSVTRTHWAGQFIAPSLPTNTGMGTPIYWQPTRVQYYAQHPSRLALLGLLIRVAVPHEYRVELVSPGLNHAPSGAHAAPLAEYLYQTGKSDYSMRSRNVSFTRTTKLKPGQPVQLVFRGMDHETTRLHYFPNSTPLVSMTQTTDAGNSWAVPSHSDNPHRYDSIPHALYGTVYFEPGTPQSLTRQHLTRIRVRTQASGGHHPHFDTAVHLPNRPGVLDRYWEADFRHDPTGLDVNADGAADWGVSGSTNFATSNLAADTGVWRARQTLRTWPDHDFTEPTLLHVRMRHTGYTTGGDGAAMVRLHVDRRGGYVGPIAVRVQRQSDGNQTFELITGNAANGLVTLKRLTDLPADFLDVRLLVSPAHRSIHLTVDGVDYGTHRYEYVGANGESRAIELTGWQTDAAEFEHIRVTVGGDA